MSLIKLVVIGSSAVLFLAITLAIIIGLVPVSPQYLKNHDNNRQGLLQNNLQSQYSADDNNTNDKNNQSKAEFHMVWTMVEDIDGMIWFSQEGPNPLWRFNPVTEKFEVIRSVSAPPMQMKIDQKTGDIWYTTFSGDKIGVIQKIVSKNAVSGSINSRRSSNIWEYKATEFN